MKFTLTILLFFSTFSFASTGVHIGSGSTSGLPSIYGISTGWFFPVKAALTTNAKDVRKTAELFAEGESPIVWTAKWNSVTQNMRGVGFPMSGVNEMGLMIQSTLSLERAPKAPANGHRLDFSQWIQYHLDNAVSVAEVIARTITADEPLIPFSLDHWNRQYQVCDLTECSVIYFSGNKAVAYGSSGRYEINYATGAIKSDPSDKWMLSVIANHTADEGAAAYRACTSFPCHNKDASLTRFIQAAEIAHGFEGKSGSPRELADALLAQLVQVDQGYPTTTWQETYLFSQSRGLSFAFKEAERPMSDVQRIEFKNFDFDCRKPVRMWWLEMDREGGIRTDGAVSLDRAQQAELVNQFDTDFSKKVIKLYNDYPFKKMECLRH